MYELLLSPGWTLAVNITAGLSAIASGFDVKLVINKRSHWLPAKVRHNGALLKRSLYWKELERLSKYN